MFFGSLTFSNLDWLWPAAGVVALCGALLWWGYRLRPRGVLSWTCAALKLAGVTILALCLMEPFWTGQRARPGANFFAILADNSQGMQIRDAGEKQSRGALLASLLSQDAGGWQATIADDFELRRFIFDARLEPTTDFNSLKFDGRASALGLALQSLRERFQGRPLAGVLLLTDGNATDMNRVPNDLSGLPPIYPVVIGRPGGARDVALTGLKVAQTAFEDAPVTLQAQARVTGFAGDSVVATLVDAKGAKVGEDTASVKRNEDALEFRFQFRPTEPGVSFYRVNLRLRSELEAEDPSGESKEATLLNNSRLVTVDRGTGPYRVLYVTGRPNWEYKFLNRALSEDPEVQLVALIRVARREAKFEFRGRSGETSNPLFRGAENQRPGEVERYDEPVIMRLNTRDELELRGGFPRVPEDLYGYCAVILDDVEAGYFTADQMALLQRYVSERGGGLLMLGGMESFENGGYQRTPVGEMLPVYLNRRETKAPAGAVRMELTREGRLAAWARLRANEGDEAVRLQSMPPFQVMNPVSGVKPGASVIATGIDEQNHQYPALITQRFGRGRTAALTIGDIWRWGMQNSESHKDMNKFWRQLVRWLVADVPQKLELKVADPGDEADGFTKLQVRVKNDSFQPVDNASVKIEIHNAMMSGTNGPAEGAIHLRAEPAPAEAGLYEAEYAARHAGGYRAVASVTNATGEAVGKAETGWSVDLAAKEFAAVEPNVALLEEIARRTGGEVLPASKLHEFARNLPLRKTLVMEPWTRPAWHTPALFLLALACFVGEWGLRRWKGMP